MKKLNGLLSLMLIAVLLLVCVPALAEETDDPASDPISIINLDELQNTLTSQQSITVQSNLWEAFNRLIALEKSARAGDHSIGIQISAEMREAIGRAGSGNTASTPVSTGEMISKIAGALVDSGTPAPEEDGSGKPAPEEGEGYNLLVGDQNGWRQYMNLSRWQFEPFGDSRLQLPEGEGTGLINTNPISALLWSDGSILPIAPGQAKLFFVDEDTGETTPAGNLDVKENESGELEGEFTPAPAEIVEFFSDAVPAGYTYGRELYLKLSNAEAVGWDVYLNYHGTDNMAQVARDGQQITAVSASGEYLDVNALFCDLLADERMRFYNEGLLLTVTATHADGTAQLALPVSGLNPIVQADGSPLPNIMTAQEQIRMKLLVPAENQRWYIRAYAATGAQLGYNFDQQTPVATAGKEGLTIQTHGAADYIASYEIKNSAAPGYSHVIQIAGDVVPDGMVFSGGSSFDDLLISDAIELRVDDGCYIGVRENGVISTDYDFTAYMLTNMVHGQVYRRTIYANGYQIEIDFDAFGNGLAEAVKDKGLSNTITGLNTAVTQSEYEKSERVFVFIEAGRNGEHVASGAIVYNTAENTLRAPSELRVCENCNVPYEAGNGHAAPCGKLLHYTCDGKLHDVCSCGQAFMCDSENHGQVPWHDTTYGVHTVCKTNSHMCIRCQTDGIPCEDIVAHADVACENIMHCNGTGDHSLRHDAAYGLHGVCAEEQKHFCIICQTDNILCSQIEAHASVACGNIEHCNGNGMEHGLCSQCKKHLCNGEEHGKGVCEKYVTITDPIIIGLGDTVNLNDYQVDYDANTEEDIRLEGSAD